MRKTLRPIDLSKLALKGLTADGGSPCHGGCSWALPTEQADGGWTPGAWLTVPGGRIGYRSRGLHLAQVDQLPYWVRHLKCPLTCWVVEYRGTVAVGAHGIAVRSARLLRPWTGKETLTAV